MERTLKILIAAVILVALYTTKIPMIGSSGIWSTLHEARTDVSMLLGLIFLATVGGGSTAIDEILHSQRGNEKHQPRAQGGDPFETAAGGRDLLDGIDCDGCHRLAADAGSGPAADAGSGAAWIAGLCALRALPWAFSLRTSSIACWCSRSVREKI